jgi:hypothetical protein
MQTCIILLLIQKLGSGPALPEPGRITVSWENNLLSIRDPSLPGGAIQVWYLEAFCRSGSTSRDWGKTVIPHRTEKVEESKDGKLLKLRSEVEGGVEVLHEIRAGDDDVDFLVTASNHGKDYVDVVWVQPCMRVGGFTGRKQEDYVEKCFIFVDGGLKTLDKTRRSEEALYRGGQVYVPSGIDRKDVNPRPLSPDLPSANLIGCFSASGDRILAMAFEPCQELFQGVIVCIHADFRLGGLMARETKTAHGKIYLAENDEKKLLQRFKRDFPPPPATSRSAEGWRINLFDPITDQENDKEKKFYGEVLDAWRAGNGLQGLLLSSKELVLHPARDEIHLLRAASVLLEIGKASAPLAALKGELTPAGSPAADGQDELVLEALSFALEEYQRAFPELPPEPAPWTGLYHPYARKSLAGSLLTFWSHGLKPLLRLEALSRGRHEIFEALEDPRPSLVDLLLKAQLLALRGEKERARGLLENDPKSLVAPESWPRWSPRITALSLLCDTLSSGDERKIAASLKDWDRETKAAIPEVGNAVIVLPARALDAAARRDEPKGAKKFARPEGQRLVEMLFRRRAGGPLGKSGGPLPAAGLSSADREVIEAVHRSGLRLRDFRADVLRRFENGGGGVILSAELLRDGGLSFVEGGKRRISLERERGTPISPESTLRIPCGDGFWLILE